MNWLIWHIRDMNLILCGLPRSGKTTFGKLLAKKMQWNFIDLDRLIEEAYLKKTSTALSCKEIFLKEGNVFFRLLEHEQVLSLKMTKQSVIALGGGALGNEDSIKTLLALGRLIYLKVPEKIVWGRLKAKGIPSFLDAADPEKDFYEMIRTRIPIYESVAHKIVETDSKTKSAIIAEILD